jgi:hypothetical protein
VIVGCFDDKECQVKKEEVKREEGCKYLTYILECQVHIPNTRLRCC